MSAKIHKGDAVIVLSGKDKKKQGKVVAVLRKKGKVIVSGINMITKHQKPVPAMRIEGGVVTKEAPIDVSKVALFDPATGEFGRVGVRIEGTKKVRFLKKTNAPISKASA